MYYYESMIMRKSSYFLEIWYILNSQATRPLKVVGILGNCQLCLFGNPALSRSLLYIYEVLKICRNYMFSYNYCLNHCIVISVNIWCSLSHFFLFTGVVVFSKEKKRSQAAKNDSQSLVVLSKKLCYCTLPHQIPRRVWVYELLLFEQKSLSFINIIIIKVQQLSSAPLSFWLPVALSATSLHIPAQQSCD